MKKHWWIALVLVFALAIPAAASQVIKIYVNGAELKSDVAAQVINGRTMVPIRAIAEYFGKDVQWNEAAKTVTITGKTNLDIATVISTDWAASGHANTKEPLAYAGVRGAGCAPCHSGNSLERFGTDNPYKATGIVSNSAADPVNSYKFDPHAADLPTPIGCATCHSGPGANILKTGIVPAKANVFTSGTTEWNVGSKDALCFTCHNARRDVKDIYMKWATPGAAKSNTYPHHGWGALVTGKGGMEYPGVKYAQSTVHQSIGCVGCHMPKEDGVISHKFEPDMATCTKCHVGQTEFTMGGNLKKELEEKLVTLEKLVLAKVPGAVRIGIDHSTAPVVDKDGKRIDAKNVPLEALVGAYNYALIIQELEHGGKGVHNPQYAKALLNESIKKLQ